MCNSELEFNEHLWKCDKVLDLLIPIFDKHKILLQSLLADNADTMLCQQ